MKTPFAERTIARNKHYGFKLRTVRLAACVALALPATHPLASSNRQTTATTWQVTNCSDGDPASLRDLIENPNNAKSGDTIDLSHLPALCGAVDSIITLQNGEIHIAQDDLTLIGPNLASGTVSVSGRGVSQVLYHSGNGTLSIQALTLEDGYAHDPTHAAGGCIYSRSSVELDQSRVINCTARTDSGYADGGGIFAWGHVRLVDSTISGNKAVASGSRGVGGGVSSHDLLVKYSSIDHNSSYDSAGGNSIGGGAAAYGTLGVYHSTIDHNSSRNGSALWSNAATHLSNSTISGNENGTSAVAVQYDAAASLEIANSTIAFNYLIDGLHVGAVSFLGNANDTVSLHSAIIAKNTVGNTDSDLYIVSGHGQLSGADNLVIATNISPPTGVITVMTDPKLGPLQLNGGRLATHALLRGSPAISQGNHDTSFPPNDLNTNDERGPGYSRTSDAAGNVTTDIGAFQFDHIFFDDFE